MNGRGLTLCVAALAAVLVGSGCQGSGTPAPAELAHGDLTSANPGSEAKPTKPPTQPSTAASASAEPVPSQESPPAHTAPASDPAAGEPAASEPAPGNPIGGVRVMPGVGQSNTEASGCLAKNVAEQAKTQATRSQPKPDASRVTATGNGIIATHELGHACCLTSKTETKIEQQHLTIIETLQGTPCRCMCSSTLQTRVGLAPGDYTVTLQLSRAGKTETVHEQSVEVGMQRIERRVKP